MTGDAAHGVEIRILGPLEVWRNGQRLELGGGRQLALLALLAVHANEVVSSDRLIDELWDGTPPATAGKVLQNMVSQLRRTIDPDQRGVLVTQGPGYALLVGADAIDARRFERLATQGHAELEADPARARELLRDALALWHGDVLADFAYERFAQAEIPRLEELRLATVEDRIDADLVLGGGSELVPELEALVAAHPLRERSIGQLIIALYRSGRQAEALETYKAARRVFQEELGLEPSAELRRLEQAILTQDPSLGSRPRSPRIALRARRWPIAVVVGILVAAAATGGALVLLRGESAPVVVPDSLVKIDVRNNEVVDVIPVGRDPGQVEVVGDYVFVTSERDGTLHRLDVRSGELVTSGSLEAGGPLAAAGDFLWVTSEARREVTRVSVSSLLPVDRITLEPDRLHAFVAVGGGSLWISQYPSPAVQRWRLRTLKLERRYDLNPSDFPVEVTYAAGAAWIGVEDGLLRIDGRSGATRRIPVGSGMSDPVYGFGSIWSGSVFEDSVWRVDARTERATAIVPVGEVSWGLAVGAGSVWATNYCDGTVSRIDPETNTVVATIETGYYPKWLAVGHGFVWVGVSGTLISPGALCE